MRFWQHTLMMGIGLFLLTLTPAMAEDTPPPQTQNEGEVQSRGLLRNEQLSCPPTCTKIFRGGTSLQLKGTPTDSLYRFK